MRRIGVGLLLGLLLAITSVVFPVAAGAAEQSDSPTTPSEVVEVAGQEASTPENDPGSPAGDQAVALKQEPDARRYRPDHGSAPPAGDGVYTYDSSVNFVASAADGGRGFSALRGAGVQTSAPSSAPGTAIRQVGRHLESVEDVFGNPQLLAGRGPGDVRAILNGSETWVEGTMRHSTSAPNGGWTFRELTTDGSNFTGRYIQWHPGTPRHFGGDAYWKVSSGPTGTVRIPQ